MRIIQAPGIELHEVDMSKYDSTVDNSIVGTTALVMGFADKGDDYNTKYINTMNTFINNYGYPTNEAERYFYNAAYEVLNRGGNLYTSKLPYDNDSLNKLSYCSYTVTSSEIELSSPYDVVTHDYGIIEQNLYQFLLMPNITVDTEGGVIHEPGKYIEVDDDKYFGFEHSSVIDIVGFFNMCGINLGIIQKLFEYISEQCNFPYSTQEVMKKYFYAGENCRNDAVYMLKLLYENEHDFREKYMVEPDDYSEISEMRSNMLLLGDDFDSWIEKFGKSLYLDEYKYYFYKLIEDVKEYGYKGGEERKEGVLNILNAFDQPDLLNMKYTGLKKIDGTLTSYVEINSNPQLEKYSGMISMKNYDKFKVDEDKVPENQIYIIDITRQKYQKDNTESNNKKEYIGILPVITTAANALYYQKYIKNNLSSEKEYNPLSCMQNKYTARMVITDEGPVFRDSMLSNLNNDDVNEKKIAGFTQSFGPEQIVTEDQVTLSKTSESYFPQITTRNGILKIDNLKKIGVVVFKMFIDDANEGRIGFTPVEAFAGTLNRKELDQTSGASVFIDRIVNSNSNYINVFSNVKFSNELNIQRYPVDRCSLFLINNQSATSLGLYEKDCVKDISIKESINNAIDLVFENNKDYNTRDIDIIIDGGVSNIAQFIKSVYRTEKGKFDFDNDKSFLFRMENQNDIKVWRNVIQKYDNFCKNVRKDCMFIADGMRPLCLVGDQKIIRPSKPENTIEKSILPRIKWMSGVINSSYGAGYCNWFRQIDHYTNEYMWIPPSIKAAGAYIYTDAYSFYWMAPAGLRRGKMPSDVIDVAFNPSNDEAGTVYINNWNYAISYPINGIVLEGQKTFQIDKTAFDRVNVRRLFLGLEKNVRYLAKFFTYEGITEYMMQRFRDTISQVFENAKTKDGIRDYIIICDSRNNNTQTIENNELHCTIAVKPVKSLEYIIMNFVATSQGASVSEVAQENI